MLSLSEEKFNLLIKMAVLSCQLDQTIQQSEYLVKALEFSPPQYRPKIRA